MYVKIKTMDFCIYIQLSKTFFLHFFKDTSFFQNIFIIYIYSLIRNKIIFDNKKFQNSQKKCYVINDGDI